MKSAKLSQFGEYLQQKEANRLVVATNLDITTSYVSMLCRGVATPGLKLAIAIAAWSKKTYGEDQMFSVERWA